MEEKLNRLKELLAEVRSLGHIAALLGWDQQVNLPPGGADDRGDHMTLISKLAHDKFVDPEIGSLLEDLRPYAAELGPESDEARLLKVVSRDYQRETRVPGRWVSEDAQVTTAAFLAWVEARQNDDFQRFQPHLQKVIDLRRDYAGFFAPFDHVYDPLLDVYEPGLKTAEVQQIFGGLRPQQVELIQAIAESETVDDSFLRRAYDEQKQWDFGVEVITKFGFDWNRGRQDKAAHPFTTTFGVGDVRITTRFDPQRAASALFSTLHEAGHGLYEQGYDPADRHSPLGSYASMAIHESQSRMWENLVGRSRPFWEHFYPRFQEQFPAEVGGVDLDTFYKGINKVEPSLIRVEADEATYNLHIMLRLELEIALMEGSLSVADLPEAWNARIREYLGITPPNNRLGVLQDIHWSSGLVGYFPTYALGNLVSVQLWEKIHADLPDLEDQIRRGEFSSLLGWLREKVHCHGARFEPQELVQRVTGSKIDAAPYVRYLRNKYSEIYGL